MADDSVTATPSLTEEPAPPQQKRVFVISPIGKVGSEPYRKANYALKFIFRMALTPEEGWNLHRADEGNSPDSIGQHVIKNIAEADLVIADLTDHNPNVFYELAIAHAWRKPVVHLISEGEIVPFDIADMRTIFYDITDLESVETTKETLRRYADHAIDHAEQLKTPLTTFAEYTRLQSEIDHVQRGRPGGEPLTEILQQLVNRMSRVEEGLGQIRQSRGGLQSELHVPDRRSEGDGLRAISARLAALLVEKSGLLKHEPSAVMGERIATLDAVIRSELQPLNPRSRDFVVRMAGEVIKPQVLDLLEL